RLIDEQQAAEIDGDRLDADANVVEVIAHRGYVVFVVDEQLLHGELIVVTRRAPARVDVDAADFTDIGAIEIDHRDEAELYFRRLERGVALDSRNAQHDDLGELAPPVTADLV